MRKKKQSVNMCVVVTDVPMYIHVLVTWYGSSNRMHANTSVVNPGRHQPSPERHSRLTAVVKPVTELHVGAIAVIDPGSSSMGSTRAHA